MHKALVPITQVQGHNYSDMSFALQMVYSWNLERLKRI